MKPLRAFELKEWLCLAPLAAVYKQVRNDIWQATYMRCSSPDLSTVLSHARRDGAGRALLVVIAFEQPWVLGWLLRQASVHLKDAFIVVCDNSRTPAARAAIQQVCKDQGTPYLALPVNATRHVNRSHGMAVSWAYRHVVRALAPKVFGFIDHDLIPIADIHIENDLGEQPFYGIRLHSEWAYQLWAGFCLYNYAAVAVRPLNFLYDFSLGLDTGGRNWYPLYRHHDPA